MIDKIQAFGDSFIHGSDLPDCDDTTFKGHSNLTWPALVAKQLNLKYQSFSQGGIGNGKISQNILNFVDQNSLVIINWSWLDRYDYYDPSTPNSQDKVIRPTDETEISKFYYKHIYSDIGGKFGALTQINSIHSYLKRKNIPFIATYLDQHLLSKSWQIAPFIDRLQDEIKDSLTTFPNNQTFLEWSRANGYPESKGWHPLELAHEKAAEYWLPIYEKAINTHITTK